MRRFSNILLALDPATDTRAALVQAVRLARENGARLRVLVVVQHPPLHELPLGTRTLIGLLDRDQLRELAEERERNRLQRQLGAIEFGDLEATTHVVSSHVPFIEVIQEVLRHGHDLLIKEATEVTGPRAALFHPTDRHLLRKCPCPVWMIRPHLHTGYRRILAAVDAFSEDEVNRELSRRILELASSQAARSGAELHVVHAYGPLGTVPPGPGGDSVAHATAITDLHRERLEALLSAFPTSDDRVHLQEGRAGEVIPAVAQRLKADLVVMGTVGRVGIPGFFIGNTAETILDRVACDVLAVKPHGFVTPVQLPESG